MRHPTFLADLHQHSRHAYATSPQALLVSMAHWAALKGLAVIGTGDFTHPAWMQDIEEQLEPDHESGLFQLKPEWEKEARRDLPSSCPFLPRFMLQVEVSCVYKKANRTRKVHHLIYARTIAQAKTLAKSLERYAKLASDGRPTLKLDSRDLLEIVLNTSSDMFLVPAHIWTPWFSMLGNRSGFDSVEGCFGDLSPYIHAVESGLSADPEMIRKVKDLDRFHIISSSDAHSPSKLGREATRFGCPVDYASIKKSIETGEGLVGTLEFFPKEGKYYYSGHRKCGRVCHEGEYMKQPICPACGKNVTMGVLDRVQSLTKGHLSSKEILPQQHQVGLEKIFSYLLGTGVTSKKVQTAYFKCIQKLGPELKLLHEIPTEYIADQFGSSLANILHRIRNQKVNLKGGYDGQYGEIDLTT